MSSSAGMLVRFSFACFQPYFESISEVLVSLKVRDGQFLDKRDLNQFVPVCRSPLIMTFLTFRVGTENVVESVVVSVVLRSSLISTDLFIFLVTNVAKTIKAINLIHAFGRYIS